MTKEPKKGSYQKKPQRVEERSIKKTAAVIIPFILFVEHFGSISKSSIRYLASDISAVSYKYLPKHLNLDISTSSSKYLKAPNTQYT